jgi:cytochrome c
MRAILATALFGTLIVAAAAQSSPQLTAQERRGEALLQRLCASCHAIGPTGTSLHAEAPPFRTLGRRYKIEALEEALAEGLISGHPDMPEYQFEPHQVGEVIAYLNAIQER